MKKNRIFFRADGDSKIGLGHIFRCLSLVEILCNNFECIFLIRNPADGVKKLIDQSCRLIELKSASKNELAEISSTIHKSDIMVIDGYSFDSEYQKEIRSKIKKLIVIDDTASHHYYADIIVNHGDPSVISKYKKEPYTRVLVGLSYAILRKEFLASAKAGRTVSKVDTVFICMGGADPFNITIKAASASFKCDFIKSVIIVTGSAYSNKVQLERTLQTFGGGKSILHEENVDAVRLVELIEMSQIAIAPASSIAMEICCVKAGLLSGTVVYNQDSTHKQLTELGCCISLGSFNTASEDDIVGHLEKLKLPSTINELMRNQSNAIDGRSGDRLLNEFRQLAVC